jgi:molecular chaperone DnaK (HSP70)
MRSESATAQVVGIDLGTTNTVVAASACTEEATPHVLSIEQLIDANQIAPRARLPSFLYAPIETETCADPWGDLPWIIGEYALRRGRQVPSRSIASAKSWLCHSGVDQTAPILPWGAPESVELPVSPVEASARVLRHCARALELNTQRDSTLFVLTVPASFNPAARQLTVRAAQLAGLGVRLLEEPQAAFYDAMGRTGPSGLRALVSEVGEPVIALVCDIGGGTTDLSLIRVADRSGALDIERLAVGRHLLLGGDNMDIALAHWCESRWGGAALDPERFRELVLACRYAKERLLGEAPPGSVPIRVLASGSNLVGATLSTELTLEAVERVVFEGFFPFAERLAKPERTRAGLVAFGLPYERDPRITYHVANFFAEHAPSLAGPHALLCNGGLFRSGRIRERIADVIRSWGGPPLIVLDQPDPESAVATGAVRFGLALRGYGLRIGGGLARGYYVGLGSADQKGRAVCVVPRGAKEGEIQVAGSEPLELTVGAPVRFELYARDGEVDPPGRVVSLDSGEFERLPPLVAAFDRGQSAHPETVPVLLEGELTALGTLRLGCVETGAGVAVPRRFGLEFELRRLEPTFGPESAARRPSASAVSSQRFEPAREAIDRVFGKGRADVKPREARDLLRELERCLGERSTWSTELARELFDVVAPKHRARRRSEDHERVYWLLSGYCLRPGFGHPLDSRRIALLEPLFHQGLQFSESARDWQQFFIAWRRMAGGLSEAAQASVFDALLLFFGAAEQKLKRPKHFRVVPGPELLELLCWLERLPAARRVELGNRIVERTWSDRDPRLWAALGRVGARVPAYASVHHVVSPRTVERWLDHLLREKWNQVSSALRAATELCRVTGDRARDVSQGMRAEVARRLEQVSAPAEWVRAVRELVPIQEAERVTFFEESLPVGLRLPDPVPSEE